MICAGKTTQALCYGDQGGPLVSNGLLVGIGSYNPPCSGSSTSVFSSVVTAKKWINKFTGV